MLRKAGTPWEITELELDAPKANEVLIQMEAAGLCHSDEHIRAKGMARLPMVTTGFCSAIYAGAKYVFAIDPNPWKQQQALDFGATHAFGDPVKAKEVLIDLTRGQLADKIISTVGEMDNDVVKAAVDMTGVARGSHQAHRTHHQEVHPRRN